MPPYLSKASHVGGHFGSVEKCAALIMVGNAKKVRRHTTTTRERRMSGSSSGIVPTANGMARARATDYSNARMIHDSCVI
jgi:hypothetical protein